MSTDDNRDYVATPTTTNLGSIPASSPQRDESNPLSGVTCNASAILPPPLSIGFNSDAIASTSSSQNVETPLLFDEEREHFLH